MSRSLSLVSLPEPVLTRLCALAIEAWERRSSAAGLQLQLVERGLLHPARLATFEHAYVRHQSGVDRLIAHLERNEDAATLIRYLGVHRAGRTDRITPVSILRLLRLIPNLCGVDLALDTQDAGLLARSGFRAPTFSLSYVKVVFFVSGAREYDAFEDPFDEQPDTWCDAADDVFEFLRALAPTLRELSISVIGFDEEGSWTGAIMDEENLKTLSMPRVVSLSSRVPDAWAPALVYDVPALRELHCHGTDDVIIRTVPDETAAHLVEASLAARMTILDIGRSRNEAVPIDPIIAHFDRMTALMSLTVTNGVLADFAAAIPRSVRRLTLRYCADVYGLLAVLEQGTLPSELGWISLEVEPVWRQVCIEGGGSLDALYGAVMQKAIRLNKGRLDSVNVEQAVQGSADRFCLESLARRIADRAGQATESQDPMATFTPLLGTLNWQFEYLAHVLALRDIDHPRWRFKFSEEPYVPPPFMWQHSPPLLIASD